MKKLIKKFRIVIGLLAVAGLLIQCTMPSQTASVRSGNAKKVSASNRVEKQIVPGKTVIKPNHVSQATLENDLQGFYQYWKAKYLKTSNGNTPGGGYYIKADSTGGHKYPIKSNSESHGYGMIIFALMGDQHVFDGMYNMYDKHRSIINEHLMSWVITVEELKSQDSDSAADGDLDIAYALLLAHDKWGSNGSINYLAEAKRMITLGIKEGDMDKTSKRVMRGDWDEDPYSTRSSDWMAGHLRAYYQATGDSFWLEAADTIYSMINTITNRYSSNTGLMPDFVVEADPKPAPPGHLEGQYDGDYYYNACRFPWRIATDYVHYGTPEAKAHVMKMLDWLMTQNNGDPSKTHPGWRLNGTKLPSYPYLSACFAAPFMVAATVDPKYQTYLNRSWEALKNKKQGYFEDTLNMLCLLMASGKWKAPGYVPVPDKEAPSIPQNLQAASNGSSITLTWNPSSDNVGVTGYSIFMNGAPLVQTGGTSYQVTALSPGVYNFMVIAHDEAGNNSLQSTPASAEITALKSEITVTFQKTGGWGNSIQGEIIIENKSTTAVDTWELVCDLDFAITSAWCGTATSAGSIYTITHAGWNARLAPGGKATVGFMATGSLTPGSVTNATVNGQSVSVTILP